jgi:hypothetical protein
MSQTLQTDHSDSRGTVPKSFNVPGKVCLTLAALAVAPIVSAFTFNEWMATFDSEVIPLEQRGFTDDPDGDGVPNGIEFLIAGMDPSSPDAYLLPKPSVIGGNFVYSVAKRPGISAANLQTMIEVLNSTSGEWEIDLDNVTEDSATITLSLPLSAGATLARIRVEHSTISSSNPIANAYPMEYSTGEYAWTDQINWDTVFDVTDYGAVADGNASFVRSEDLVLFGVSSDPLRPNYVIPAGIPHSWGTDNHAAFTAAIAAAYDAGGGVVYIPEGTYYIADHLFLREGVVLLGSEPVEGERNALEASFNPPSKLIFPRYFTAYDPVTNPNGNPVGRGGAHIGFKRIFTENPLTASNLGLVWLDINRAAIIIDTPSRLPIDTGANWSGKPGTIRQDLVGTNRVVFGVRSNNTVVAEGADGSNTGVPWIGDGQLPWQRWPYRFNANIRIGGGGNTLVANCRLNDLSAQNDFRWGSPGEVGPATHYDDSFEQIGYLGQAPTGSTQYALNNIGQATFLHSNHYGISVNGLFYFSSAGQVASDPDGNPGGHFGTPVSAPHMFATGNVVRDSYVFSTLGAKAEISGQGMRFLNNYLDDVSGKRAFLRSDGRRQPTGSAFMSRSMLYGGYDVLIDGNTVLTFQHRIGNIVSGGDGGYFVNDGEGLMIDNTTTRVNGLTITNNKMGASIFCYRTRETRNVLIANNEFLPGSSGALLIITNDANKDDYGMQNVIIENNVMRLNNIRIAASVVLNANPNVNDLTPTNNVIIRNNEAVESTRQIQFNASIENLIELENNINFTIHNTFNHF